MTNYNQKYNSLSKRLSILKLLTKADNALTDEQRSAKLKYIDSLFKMLDDRYSSGKYLDELDSVVSKLEKKG